MSSECYKASACDFDEVRHTGKIFFDERVRIDTREKISVKGHENCDGANASREDARDPRPTGARANQELPERGHVACAAATRFGAIAFAAVWITQLIIGASIAATTSASRSMISALRILMSGLDDPLVFAGRLSGTSSQASFQRDKLKRNKRLARALRVRRRTNVVRRRRFPGRSYSERGRAAGSGIDRD